MYLDVYMIISRTDSAEDSKLKIIIIIKNPQNILHVSQLIKSNLQICFQFIMFYLISMTSLHQSSFLKYSKFLSTEAIYTGKTP